MLFFFQIIKHVFCRIFIHSFQYNITVIFVRLQVYLLIKLFTVLFYSKIFNSFLFVQTFYFYFDVGTFDILHVELNDISEKTTQRPIYKFLEIFNCYFFISYNLGVFSFGIVKNHICSYNRFYENFHWCHTLPQGHKWDFGPNSHNYIFQVNFLEKSMLVFFGVVVFLVQKLENFDPWVFKTVHSFHAVNQKLEEMAHLLLVRDHKVDLSVRQF